jgi:HlyD family secretion protein
MVHPASRQLVCALLAGAAVAAGAAGCRKEQNGATSKPALGGPARRIVALGRLEPAGGVLEISAIPGDVLKEFADGVEEGETVNAGDILAWVDSYDLRATQLEVVDQKLELGRQEREQQIALAEANVEQARATRAEAEAKLAEARAQGDALESLAEAVRIAEDDYQALVELQASDPALVTEQQLRRKRNQADQAAREQDVRTRTHAATLRAALAAVAATVEHLELAELNLQLARDIDRNRLTEIERKVALETLEQSILRAPETDDGATEFEVLKILVEPGEFVTQIPVLQIADVTRMVCIAEVYEADAKLLGRRQKAKIYSAAMSGDYAEGDKDGDGVPEGGIEGEVLRVGSLVSSAGMIQRNPLAPSDRSIVEVLIAIDPEDAKATEEAASHIGLQVTVYFGPKPNGAEDEDAADDESADEDDDRDET